MQRLLDEFNREARQDPEKFKADLKTATNDLVEKGILTPGQVRTSGDDTFIDFGGGYEATNHSVGQVWARSLGSKQGD